MTVGFVGDIMDMRGKRLQISPAVVEFFRDCDFVIGNFEATITRAGKRGLAAQVHDPAILDALTELSRPDRTFLSIANNHAGDFPPAIFRQSLDSLRKRGFRVFGLRQEPFADLTGRVRVVAASMWSNHPCSEIAPLASLDASRGAATLNIAYPHWGYELEMFPRPAIVCAGKRFLQDFDAVIGHHPHVPQPLVSLKHGNGLKLLAFSLGDFCTGLRIEKFQYGIVCKVEMGPGETGLWQISGVHWRYIRTNSHPEGGMRVEFAASSPPFERSHRASAPPVTLFTQS